MPTRATRATKGLAAVGLIGAVTLMIAGCGAKEEQMSPDEAREALTTITHDTADLLAVDGWAENGAPLVSECSSGVKWAYFYGAPLPDSDRAADAKTVAEYWKSLGIEVRTNTEHDPVVFGTGGPIQSISFSTGPSVYDISGTSLCVPGDADDYR